MKRAVPYVMDDTVAWHTDGREPTNDNPPPPDMIDLQIDRTSEGVPYTDLGIRKAGLWHDKTQKSRIRAIQVQVLKRTTVTAVDTLLASGRH